MSLTLIGGALLLPVKGRLTPYLWILPSTRLCENQNTSSGAITVAQWMKVLAMLWASWIWSLEVTPQSCPSISAWAFMCIPYTYKERKKNATAAATMHDCMWIRMQGTEQWRAKQNTNNKTKRRNQSPHCISHTCAELHIWGGEWKAKLVIGPSRNHDLLWTPVLNLVYCNTTLTQSEGPEGLKESRDHGNIAQL